MSYDYTAFIILLPLASFILLGLFGRQYFKNVSGIIGCASLLISAVLSIYAADQYFFVNENVAGTFESIIPVHYTWLEFSPDISIDMGILLDPISVMMLVVVTVISLMVHIYSLGYMKGEERFSTYYAFLSLFTFSMLGLVVSSNIFQIYIFWELVGVSSYLLIGYYYDRPTAVAAAKKAFVVTRFADLGFLIGILILAFGAETLDFQTLIHRLTDIQTTQFVAMNASAFLGVSLITWALVLVFIGGAGKSAMFPLHIWLPDAMEGPTPVSALIHAATMVVAGVFLVARLFPVFHQVPAALDVVTIVGITSALFAAIIACTQTDIKRVLAYSTMSQIGFMMFALGVSGFYGAAGSGFTASMFHLFTHAFFKALLFLGAGVVIHLVHSNEMKDMGGLRKLAPVAHLTFLIACFAIAGVPPFAGFFSKEEILHAAYESHPWVYYVALITSGITAFYMFRLYFSIFWNKESQVHEAHGEGPWSMKLPLILLAIGAAFAGFIPFSKYISPEGTPFHSEFHFTFSIAPVLIGLSGIFIAYVLYFRESTRPQRISESLGALYRTVHRKFYVDEIYSFITKRIIFNLVGRPSAWFDRTIVDGTMNGIARATATASETIKAMQSGKVQSYGIWFFGAIIGMVVLFLYLWK